MKCQEFIIRYLRVSYYSVWFLSTLVDVTLEYFSMDCRWECYTTGSRITKNIVRSLLKDYKKKNECTKKKLRLVVPPDVMADKINIFSKYL